MQLHTLAASPSRARWPCTCGWHPGWRNLHFKHLSPAIRHPRRRARFLARLRFSFATLPIFLIWCAGTLRPDRPQDLWRRQQCRKSL